MSVARRHGARLPPSVRGSFGAWAPRAAWALRALCASPPVRASAASLLLLGASACAAPEGSACGPTRANVARVIDGDTVELSSGERVRYLLVDTPENTTSVECFGPEATAFNQQLVEGREVRLRYDVECTDRFGRLLAYVEVDGRTVNELLVEQGYACVLHIPPNGADDAPLYEDLETRAVDEGRGLWSVCAEDPC